MRLSEAPVSAGAFSWSATYAPQAAVDAHAGSLQESSSVSRFVTMPLCRRSFPRCPAGRSDSLRRMAKADEMQKLFDASQEVAREAFAAALRIADERNLDPADLVRASFSQLQMLSFGLGGRPRHGPPGPKPKPRAKPKPRPR
jgi:hypothetical protein